MLYKHQVVSDLAYILQAPLIYQDIDLCQYWSTDWQHQLVALDQNPEPLIESLAKCKSHFLGSYFESLFSFALKHLSKLEIIFEHKQLISAQRTLGEVDALVRDHDNQVHMLEIAIKYYLASNQEEGHWVGPNKNDSFIKKYERAKTHQLKLLDRDEAKSLLDEYQIKGPIKCHLLMFGLLFEQLANKDDLFLLQNKTRSAFSEKNEKINSAAKIGCWIKIDHLDWLEPHFMKAQELLKPHWLSNPIEQVVNKGEYRQFSVWKAAIEARFQQDVRPRQFVLHWEMTDLNMGYTRLFVVPSDW